MLKIGLLPFQRGPVKIASQSPQNIRCQNVRGDFAATSAVGFEMQISVHNKLHGFHLNWRFRVPRLIHLNQMHLLISFCH